MRLFEIFKSTPRQSANDAKERLQIIIAHDRLSQHDSPDWLPALKRDLLEVIRRYVPIDQDMVKVSLDREDDVEVLELNIILPEHTQT